MDPRDRKVNKDHRDPKVAKVIRDPMETKDLLVTKEKMVKMENQVPMVNPVPKDHLASKVFRENKARKVILVSKDLRGQLDLLAHKEPLEFRAPLVQRDREAKLAPTANAVPGLEIIQDNT